MCWRFSFLPTALLTVSLVSCSGGGGGGDSAAPVAEPQVIPVSFLDSIPQENANRVSVDGTGFSLIHMSQSGAEFNYQMNCADLETFTVRRIIIDLADAGLLVDHKFSCPNGLDSGTQYTFGITEARQNGQQLEGTRTLTTGINGTSLNILLERQSSQEDVNSFFANYISDALAGQFDLTPALQQLLLTFIIDLAASEWDNLAEPGVLHDVVSQRVQYGSTLPDGNFSNELTGLVAFPDVQESDTFVKRAEVILLTHATGSTPSDLNDNDAWYILANLFAGHGYLVVAPDNYGRGGTSDFPETYLQANRTGMNAVDLLRRVSEDSRYEFVFDETTPVDVNIIGYSQGGHSAIASWLAIVRHHSGQFQVRRVHSGGAPHDLYKTVRGVLNTLPEPAMVTDIVIL